MGFINYRKSLDKNQKVIVNEFKRLGAGVLEINGVVDLIVGFNNQNILVEVKNPNGKNKLTKSQIEFINIWGAEIHIVRNCEDVQKLLNLYS